ncbi:hypothetical protein QAD02_004867 [Eretmocerus hayati]|uniref:Uncharacterized protein n=1 Tax=Eretmocerus hayati TaxID=131215 RepID=A0ACC2NVL5_9HYME|nr:hypothetical protein QAD02_004867 [Eretmocerus hayati]
MNDSKDDISDGETIATLPTKDPNKNQKLPGVVFVLGLSGMFLLSGFGGAFSSLKKRSTKLSAAHGTRDEYMIHQEGRNLALKALAWGTLYSTLGTGLLCYGTWKLSGASTFEEFRSKMKNLFSPLTTKTSSN